MAINSASLEWVYLWTCTQICGHWIPTSPRKMGSGAARTWPEVRTYTCCCCWSEHSLLPGCRCQGHERQVPSTAQGKAHAPSAHIPCLCTLRGGDSNLNLASWQPLPWLEGFFFLAGVVGGSGVDNICSVALMAETRTTLNPCWVVVVFHQSLIHHHLMATGGTWFHSECWAESPGSPNGLPFSGKYYICDNIRE